MILYGRCPRCRKKRWLLYKRSLKLPKLNQIGTTPEELCGKCEKGIRATLAKI